VAQYNNSTTEKPFNLDTRHQWKSASCAPFDNTVINNNNANDDSTTPEQWAPSDNTVIIAGYSI
jgi:hypothetical protein